MRCWRAPAPVAVVGIDETRRGKGCYQLDEDGRTVLQADTWHTRAGRHQRNCWGRSRVAPPKR